MTTLRIRPDDDADRPSRLALDRFATGELKGDERAKVQAWLDKNPEGFAHLEELRKVRKAVRPLDVAALRERAGVPKRQPTYDPGDADDVAPPVVEEEEDVSDDVSDHATVPFAPEREASPAESAGEIVDEAGADALDAALAEASQVQRRGAMPTMPIVSLPPADELPAAPKTPKPANRPFNWMWVAPAMLLAATLAMVVVPKVMGGGPKPAGDVTFRGGDATLAVFALENGDLHAYKGTALGQGDTIGFQVVPGEHRSVVVLSVDGQGKVSVFYPENGEDPEPLPGTADASVPLPGSIVLDAAPGPEVFVAVFDEKVGDAKEFVESAWKQGGATGVEQWAEKDPAADAVVVQRK